MIDSETTVPEPDPPFADRAMVLELEGARLPLDPAGGTSEPVDLALPPGSLTLVAAPDRAQGERLCDAVLGLRRPVTGRVLFLGRDWQEVSPLQAEAMRGRVGQVFATGGWIAGLTVAESVLMSQMYHTRRHPADVRDEAARLAASFGLPGMPLGRPADLSPADLQRAACVRAFLGRPRLVLLHDPCRGLGDAILEPLIHAARAARDRDAAVLWLSPDVGLCADASMPADSRHRLRGGSLRPLGRISA